MKPMESIRYLTLGAAFAALSGTAFAHHSNAEYDRSMKREIEGELVSLRWTNPHIAFDVATTDEDGNEVVWNFEALAVSALNRRGVTGEHLQVGDRVRVAGFASSRREHHMHAEHVLLPGNVELLTGFSRDPIWSSGAIGTESGVVDPALVDAPVGEGIFRVWTRTGGTWYFATPENYPLTAEAAAAAADWNDLEDNPILRCEPPGMPVVMGNPYPMEFTDRGDVIELRFEEFDAVREIHLDGAMPSNQPHSHMGYSTGSWVGNTLVVSTARINWPYFNRVGVPQTEDVEVTER
ncbi:MAG TPA: DUF6152 family protein, partial [Gammaproteobacteria bacterium]